MGNARDATSDAPRVRKTTSDAAVAVTFTRSRGSSSKRSLESANSRGSFNHQA